MSIPEDYLDLMEGSHVGFLATVNTKCQPQVTPIWIEYDHETGYVVFNTAEGRLKVKNIRSNPMVALSVPDSDNPYRYISLQGKVVSIDDDQEKAKAHINKLAHKYWGDNRDFPIPEGQKRLIVFVKPTSVHVSG
ncbi:MAG: PPOX class F420-dependent oxidoreductase [Methanobacteriota archaeon]|nr:MAG: PPOX class F420-dependent oxidoreductase [Euryarchaeota archaeon]